MMMVMLDVAVHIVVVEGILIDDDDDDDDDDHVDVFFPITCINSETLYPGRNLNGKTKLRAGSNREALGTITPVPPYHLQQKS